MAKKDELNFENENNMASSEKLKALQAAMDKIEKSFGKGSIMKMGDESVEQVEVIPSRSIQAFHSVCFRPRLSNPCCFNACFMETLVDSPRLCPVATGTKSTWRWGVASSMCSTILNTRR